MSMWQMHICRGIALPARKIAGGSLRRLALLTPDSYILSSCFWLLAPSRAQRGICFIFFLLTFHSSLVTAQITPQSIIATVAGTTWIFRGDGGPAIDAPLGSLRGITADLDGNVFVADSDNKLVMKISPSGILTVVAGNGFSSSFARFPDGEPATSEVLVLDDCGRPVTEAILVARFSNGDSPVALVSLRNGLYSGTWRPVNPNEQVVVTVRADLPSLPAVEVIANGRVNANPEAPILFSRGVVNAATFASGQALAPGTIVSVFGINLAQGLNVASQVPLETALGEAR